MSVKMQSNKNYGVIKVGNVFYLSMRDRSNANDWQHRSSFATDVSPFKCSIEAYNAIAAHLENDRYVEAALLAERFNDHDLKMRACMDGIRHYNSLLKSSEKEPHADANAWLGEKSAIHKQISTLYEILRHR